MVGAGALGAEPLGARALGAGPLGAGAAVSIRPEAVGAEDWRGAADSATGSGSSAVGIATVIEVWARLAVSSRAPVRPATAPVTARSCWMVVAFAAGAPTVERKREQPAATAHNRSVRRVVTTTTSASMARINVSSRFPHPWGSRHFTAELQQSRQSSGVVGRSPPP